MNRNAHSEPTTILPQQSEAKLRVLLDDPGRRKEALIQLAELWRRQGRVHEASQLVETYISEATNEEELAFGSLGRGIMAEGKGDFAKAAFFYCLGLGYACKDLETRYLLLNNLGFSLNQLGRFVEAEPHLRRALELGLVRGNAYKNLGLSLKGQGRLLEAARTFAQGMTVFPPDTRSQQELRSLHHENPGLLETDPPTWILAERWLQPAS